MIEDKTCVNLTNGLRIHTDGTYNPCCLSIETKLKDKTGRVLHVDTDSIEDALNSHTLKELREQTKNGKTPSACSVCWKEEAAGMESKRIRDNRKVKNQNVKPDTLHLLELNLGNVCNLACRSCAISATINWKKEHNLVAINPLPDKKLQEEVKKYSYPFRDTGSIWEDLKKNLSSVVYLDLYGGEPMLMKKQWDMLRYSVETGAAKNQHVHFNTNGTIFKQEYVQILKNFKFVDISFSLDGIGEKFNYIRHLGDWDVVEKNIDKWLQSTKNLFNFKYNICFTVSILNVLDFPEIALWSKNKNIRIHSNIIHYPEYYNIVNIPNELKDKITQILNNSWITKLEMPIYKEHQEIINFMLSTNGDIDKWTRFNQVTKILDKSRNQSLEYSLPELYKLITTHL